MTNVGQLKPKKTDVRSTCYKSSSLNPKSLKGRVSTAKMPGNEVSPELASFLNLGIYHLQGSNAIFVDPVRILNGSYTRFEISPSAYYSRSFISKPKTEEEPNNPNSNSRKKKRKRKPKACRDLNEREIAAEQRHQEVRPLLVNAQSALLQAEDLLMFLPNIVKGEENRLCNAEEDEQNIIELGNHSRTSLYEISLCFGAKDKRVEREGLCRGHNGGITIPMFNNLICNCSTDEVEAEVLSKRYIIPGKSGFYMSDLKQIRGLISALSDPGFNLLVIDPPWENGSVYQKAMYPTLPNQYFLYLPIKELAHTEGALVALWMTNREKLRMFVEKELFPAWGVTHTAVLYWLKVKPDGFLIGELDLFHHRPYESLLIGYINTEGIHSEFPTTFTYLQDRQVFISIPGAYSRKPPLEKLLCNYIPGPKPAKCIELFARELVSGWTSWGNEPLRFQDSKYFVEKSNK